MNQANYLAMLILPDTSTNWENHMTIMWFCLHHQPPLHYLSHYWTGHMILSAITWQIRQPLFVNIDSRRFKVVLFGACLVLLLILHLPPCNHPLITPASSLLHIPHHSLFIPLPYLHRICPLSVTAVWLLCACNCFLSFRHKAPLPSFGYKDLLVQCLSPLL